MSARRLFRDQKTVALLLLAVAVLAAVTYGVATSQTSYGCGSPSYEKDTVLQPNATRNDLYNHEINWNVLLEPCFYVYFTGIVGGSVLLILLIPVPEKKVQVTLQSPD